MDFGPENRALQSLVREVLGTIASLHPRQFGTGNGGTHAAIQHIAQAMKDGFVWAFEIDIENCFPSFDGNKVADLLPLPKEVTGRVVLSRHLNLVPGNLLDLFGGVSGGVDQGVPQGVPHAPTSVLQVVLAFLVPRSLQRPGRASAKGRPHRPF
jgi:hypothetical protein